VDGTTDGETTPSGRSLRCRHLTLMSGAPVTSLRLWIGPSGLDGGQDGADLLSRTFSPVPPNPRDGRFEARPVRDGLRLRLVAS